VTHHGPSRSGDLAGDHSDQASHVCPVDAAAYHDDTAVSPAAGARSRCAGDRGGWGKAIGAGEFGSGG
jgi:hypothetical protein